MKKIFSIFLIVFILTSCINKEKVSDEVKQSSGLKSYTVKDFFPFHPDRRMKYEGIGNEYAEKEVLVDYIAGDRIQLRTINPGTEMVQVYEIKNGELRIVYYEGEVYYRDKFIDMNNDKSEILLKEPLQVGTQWYINDGRKRYISSINKKIKLPFGEVEALEVTTEGKDYKTYDYYAYKLGHVKSVFESGEMKIETNLETIEEKAVLTKKVKIYYPDYNKDRIVYKWETVDFSTNDTIKDKLEYFFKKPPYENLSKILGENTKINNMYFNSNDNVAYVDLSKEFISELNVGAGLEGDILQSLVNTVGEYYNCERVSITIEGSPYESGHISLEDKNPVKVEKKNTIEIK
ncbi:hypothetical protein Q428_06535 [Fervidicella metallireducens AeB]|uniref:GerMN domain-containing protein n=1 Tax=Fervidicella metallireducens AeB TaxID=1403537 RepID=A0A017RVA6_9CLOT|nr:GerMN domain-containing protein [Fervidicella metallireducens]EYE88703.1 hypothetical protein Q428_06535 [Fervidicella metallireducens AeB]